ncbi:FadR/GntR family transcriptional regulator [Rhodoferax sp. WC2427]|uniref:FadR/GntR family transcriptional regulator n=1 Tax=Rhodoferax sp. WC2427 TaxID=3234144 RepID=UPI0034671BB7
MFPTMPDHPARTKSQPQRVVDGVSERIHSGALKPGDRVPSEPGLMQEFNVSRTVVREAMSRLQASGLVETRQGVGTFVLASAAPEPLLAIGARDLQVRQKLAMLELRISLESEAASLAAVRRREEHLVAMRAALDAFDAQRRTGGSTTEPDFQFHVQIAAATGNEYFEEVLTSLGNATIPRAAPDAAASRDSKPAARFGEAQPMLESGKAITQREHEAIYEAIRRGDAAAARAAMFMHLSNSRERMRANTESGASH